MNTEVRFLLAIVLMILVMVGTNILFPPVPPDEVGLPTDVPAEALPDGTAEAEPPPGFGDTASSEAFEDAAGSGDTVASRGGVGDDAATAADPSAATGSAPPAERPAVPRRSVAVTGPLYEFTFSNYGGALENAELPGFPSMRGQGAVALLREDVRALVPSLVAGRDTLSLADAAFSVEPADGLRLREGGGPETLTFSYTHPSGAVGVELRYTFSPDSYVVGVEGTVRGADRPLLVTTLGPGLAYNEADSAQEARTMAYVGNHVEEGISSTALDKVDEAGLDEGPFRWVALKSKFFVLAMLAGEEGEQSDYIGGILLSPDPDGNGPEIAVAQGVDRQGRFDYRLYMGPQEYSRLSSVGDDFQEVNPYGWRVFRPIIRPFVSIIMAILVFLHNTLRLGYGWVLIVFGVLLRIVLWPLHQKAMRSQIKNMAVQPLLKEIQAKYKDNPEKLQKEMMKLYKEHGFNPLGGCLPMLIPWPVLIALFFVFQNTIELRGVPFLWISDLSAMDPLYILPLFLALSMFLMQYMSYKSMPQDNPQMKFMMWFFPLFFGFIFSQFPSGLNLYYASTNVASLPQQYLIVKERKKAQAKGPLKMGSSKK